MKTVEEIQKMCDEAHKKADEWYNRGVIPCRRGIQQDICAWYKDDDSQFREVVKMGFFHGYMKAIKDYEGLIK